jgi:hypothetical protein
VQKKETGIKNYIKNLKVNIIIDSEESMNICNWENTTCYNRFKKKQRNTALNSPFTIKEIIIRNSLTNKTDKDNFNNEFFAQIKNKSKTI